MNIITNHVKGVQAGFQYPINQEVTKNADGSGGTIYKQTSWKDWGHTALDVLGMVPAVGNIADGINAAWYAAEGDIKNAGLSAAAAIPGLGLFSGGTKLSLKAADAMSDINKATKTAADAKSKIEKGKKIAKHTDPSVENIGKVLQGKGDNLNKIADDLYAQGGTKMLKAVPDRIKEYVTLPGKNYKNIPENLKKNFREGSFSPVTVSRKNKGIIPFRVNLPDRPVKLTTGENVLEYGNAAYQFTDGVYEGVKGEDNTVQPGSYKKQRYVGGVAPSGRQSLKSFKKFTNNTVYHGFNDRKDPVRKK
jgi:hypothetical protein